MRPTTTPTEVTALGSEDESARVLVVDDEPYITDLVSTALRYVGFEVAVASTGHEAVGALAEFRPELVVLDIMLPDMNGFDVLRRIRSDGLRIPVVFLTAKDATEDKVTGLTIGGDDYVTKPFSLEELIARVRAVLRRARSLEGDSGRISVGDLELDDDTHRVWRDSNEIELTATEFKLLRYLMLNSPRVLSKAQILDHVWNYDFGGDANIVETYISYLRKKVDRSGSRLIQTVRGVGYTVRTSS